MLSDPVAEAFGLIHRHPSGENLWYGLQISDEISVLLTAALGFKWNPLWH